MRVIDASDKPNDQHGYSVYTLVLLVSDPVASNVHNIRSLVRPRRAMIDAHVTALGTFCDIDDLAILGDHVMKAVAGTVPLTLAPAGEILKSHDGTSVAVTVEITPGLQALHDRLAESVLSIAVNAYSDPSQYRAHMTFYQEIPESEVATGFQLAQECELEPFSVDAVTLVGRVGTASSGEWRKIRDFPFAG
ncbi:MAG: 2'-5' RNA ligase family protein [Dehalococcoidia bacterium]|jgi:hypothetical protein|nr:2'-5' RNA ligase family protein [Dehalococcoidia bacterium]